MVHLSEESRKTDAMSSSHISMPLIRQWVSNAVAAEQSIAIEILPTPTSQAKGIWSRLWASYIPHSNFIIFGMTLIYNMGWRCK